LWPRPFITSMNNTLKPIKTLKLSQFNQIVATRPDEPTYSFGWGSDETKETLKNQYSFEQDSDQLANDCYWLTTHLDMYQMNYRTKHCICASWSARLDLSLNATLNKSHWIPLVWTCLECPKKKINIWNLVNLFYEQIAISDS
jgi:hypothetical protein